MLIADLIHSCSNDKVAQAALACVDGRFADRVRAAAHEKGICVGKFIVIAVSDFARRADEAAHKALLEKMSGDDQPLLKGLCAMLEAALENDALFFHEGDVDAPYALGRYAFELRYQ